MNAQGMHFRSFVVVFCVIVQIVYAVTVRPGRYVPELHGADRGRYVPDLSGKYHHKPLEYGGGYGDSGLKYLQSAYNGREGAFETPELDGLMQLGPKDHLRFMIDFNFKESGWRIVQFEWVRDGSEEHQYHYVNENKLWTAEDMESATTAQAPDNETGSGDPIHYNDDAESVDRVADAVTGPADSDLQAVHVEGEYNDNAYNVSYMNDVDAQTKHNTQDVRQAIKEILDYIQRDILPTLP